MNWAQRRKLTYVAIILIFFAIVAFAIIHKVTDVVPTCFDHKQNEGEAGVDCGGPCSNYCPNQLTDPIVEWVRAFPVTPGIVDAVAYIKTAYPTASAQNVGYDFKLYDSNNTLIADRQGTTFLGPAGNTAIVETLIPVANNTISLARFSFVDPLQWQTISSNFFQVVINTDQYSVESINGGTRLTAILQNQSRYNFFNTDVVALFYDSSGNVIGASKALVPELPGLQSTTVYFTWSYPITNIARTEILPRINPFTAQSL